MDKEISMPVIRRLPRYYRFLSDLQNQNVERVSSNDLSKIMNSTASQVRQDLNCFGGFGHQGIGYPVAELKESIGEILGINKQYKAILLGAGNLGRAVATHMNFEDLGFSLIGIFEKDPSIIGTMLRGITIKSDNDINDFLKENKVDAAFLCLPELSAVNNIELLYKEGIRNFWNFSHYDINKTHKDTIVESVHMSDSLMTLCYRMTQNK